MASPPPGRWATSGDVSRARASSRRAMRASTRASPVPAVAGGRSWSSSSCWSSFHLRRSTCRPAAAAAAASLSSSAAAAIPRTTSPLATAARRPQLCWVRRREPPSTPAYKRAGSLASFHLPTKDLKRSRASSADKSLNCTPCRSCSHAENSGFFVKYSSSVIGSTLNPGAGSELSTVCLPLPTALSRCFRKALASFTRRFSSAAASLSFRLSFLWSFLLCSLSLCFLDFLCLFSSCESLSDALRFFFSFLSSFPISTFCAYRCSELSCAKFVQIGNAAARPVTTVNLPQQPPII
mmetsp:Transcript_10791/g.32406  ORF Transcript_10791/g.32406 Transcript_10791/m.32406 type:complete len:295 (-) Transcript_10791:26-910(-)